MTVTLLSCIENKHDNNIINKADKIEELINLYTDYEGFNGAVLVSHDNEIIYKKGFGYANMEWDIPNNTDTKFQIASLTKSFTAMLIMQLVSENKLDLHQPISTYLEKYPKENGDQITVHHLLTHSAGIGRDPSNKEKYNRPEAMVNQFADVPLEFSPGEKFKYSNSGYTLLGYIIESITNKPYEEVLEDKIFKPLKMNNTGFFRHRKLLKNMASGYIVSYGEYFDSDASDKSTAYAAGAIYSTVEDLALWDQALNTEALLPKHLMELIFRKHIEDTEEGGYYGYGWEFKNKPIGNTKETIQTVGHSGSIDGFRALYSRIPSQDASIILLNNTNRAFLNSITKAIIAILNEKPYDFPLKPLAKFMTKIIKKEGIDKGIQFYKTHKDLPDYYISEQELIVAGYKFLHSGNATYAAEVFKLSTEVFPNKDNPFDSYAEALRALGEKEKAIKNYKKSLDLNPKNMNAVKMLKELGVTYSVELLNADDTWGKEIITFPIDWAPKMTVTGFEELRFAPEWSNINHNDFWSLAMAWKINTPSEISIDNLQKNLEGYFDGLMIPNHWSENFPKPNLKLMPISESDNSSEFKGKLILFDGFHTGKQVTLNITGKQQFCKATEKSVIIFKFSPKPYDKPIWKQLNNITIKDEPCN